MTVLDERTALTTVPLHPVLAERWSTRAFDASSVDDDQVVALLEAARWAPSAMNAQPWRFLVGRRGELGPDRTWQVLHDSLAEGNRLWADRAPLLIAALARTTDPDGRPRPVAPYELGLAVAQLSMQAHADGLSVHQMGGFDSEALSLGLDVPSDFSAVVVLAVGRRGSDDHLPDFLRERERAPRQRLPLEEIAFAETWGSPAELRTW